MEVCTELVPVCSVTFSWLEDTRDSDDVSCLPAGTEPGDVTASDAIVVGLTGGLTGGLAVMLLPLAG